jgi:hypothetical protein
LFSTPVPKPVVVAPLQVTTAPDCTQAAAAGPADNTAAEANDKEKDAASLSRALPKLAQYTTWWRAVQFLVFIGHSQNSFDRSSR